MDSPGPRAVPGTKPLTENSPYLAYDPGDRNGLPGRHPGLSVVVPCYDEEGGLAELHARLTRVCLRLGLPYELVFVNDGSSDRTWQRMLSLASVDEHLVLVNLSRNYGHQSALTAGLMTCRGQRVLIIDADLQDPPELLPEMMRAMDDGADVVYGQRRVREGEGRFKLATAWLFYRLIGMLSDVSIPRDTGDFRLISRRALDVLQSMPERHRFIRGMVSWVGFRQVPLLYDRRARFAGETKYSVRKMTRFARDAIVTSSTKPLALASFAGGASVFGSCLAAAWSSALWLTGRPVPELVIWTAVIAFFAGVQLLALGIMGEYVGRIFEQCKGRPLFVVDRIVRGGAGAVNGYRSTAQVRLEPTADLATVGEGVVPNL